MATLPSSSIPFPLSRRNTFDLMLEVERKNQLERIQAANSPTRRPLPPLTSALPHSEQVAYLQKATSLGKQTTRVEIRPPRLQLSLRSRSPVTREETTTRYITQESDDSVIASPVEPINDAKSETSSICHSPSWSDYGGKKKKQKKAEAKQRRQERRQSKEKVEVLSKTSHKSKRLIKAPPGLKKSRRSTSTPALQTVHQSPVDDNLFTALAHTAQAPSTGPAFIGGVKLKEANKVTAGENSEQPQNPARDGKDQEKLNSKSDVVSSWAHNIQSYDYSDTGFRQAMSNNRSANDTCFAARIAKEAQLIGNSPEITLPTFDFEDKGRRRTQRYSTVGSYASGLGSAQGTRQEKIRAAVEADLASIRSRSSRGQTRPTSARSPDRGSMMSIDSIENPHPRDLYGLPRRRSHRSVNADARQFSNIPEKRPSSPRMDEPLTPPYDEHLKPAVGSSILITKDEARQRILEEHELDEEFDRYHTFLLESAATQSINNSGQLSAGTNHDLPAGENQGPASSKPGFQAVARAAFSRKITGPSSSDSSLEYSRTASGSTISLPEPQRPSLASLTPSMRRAKFKKGSVSKIEQILGSGASTAVIPVNSSRNKTPSKLLSRFSMIERSDNLDRTWTTSSSNISTPIESRPQSCQPPFSHEHTENSSASSVRSIPESRSQKAGKPDIAVSQVSFTVDANDSVQTEVSPVLARSQSTPVMNDDLKLLPELKHRALARPQENAAARRSVTIAALPTEAPSGTHSSTKSGRGSILKPSPATESQIADRAETPIAASAAYLREARLSAPGVTQVKAAGRLATQSEKNGPPNEQSEPIAKMFVICCKCKFFHDLPSKIYEAMAAPNNIIHDPNLGVSGQISTLVRCPWCAHGMSTQCCAGYAAVVQLRERFH